MHSAVTGLPESRDIASILDLTSEFGHCSISNESWVELVGQNLAVVPRVGMGSVLSCVGPAAFGAVVAVEAGSG